MSIINATWDNSNVVQGVYPALDAKVTKFNDDGEVVVPITPQMVHAIVLLCGVGHKIDAIKLFREVNHCHLGSAKKVVDYIWGAYGHA